MSSKAKYLAKPDALRLTQQPGHMARLERLEELVSEQASKEEAKFISVNWLSLTELQTTADVIVCSERAFNAKFGFSNTANAPFAVAIATVLRSNPDLTEAQGCAVKAFKAYERALAPDYVPRVWEKSETFSIPHLRDGDLQLPQGLQAEAVRLVSEICSYEHKDNREVYEAGACNALNRLADILPEKAAQGVLTPVPANSAVMETAAASIDAELMGWLKPRKTDDIIVVHFDLTQTLDQIALTACGGRESGLKYAKKAVRAIKPHLLNLWRGLLVHSGVTYKGEEYTALTATPGQQRKDEAYFVKKSFLLSNASRLMVPGGTRRAAEQMRMLGKKVFFSKYMQYLGLGLSTARPSSKTNLGVVRLRNLVCLKEPEGFLEAENVINVVVDDVNNLKVERPGTTELKPVNPGDGSVVFIKEHMSKSAADMCVQIRAQFGVKGCGPVVPLLRYLKERGYSTRVIDVDGDVVDVADPEVKGIITPDEWKTKDFFASWKEYVRLAEKAGVDEVYVAGDNTHPQKGYVKLSNQMVQSLWSATEQELSALVECDLSECRRLETLEGAYDEFAKLHNPWLEKSNQEKLVAVAPAFLNTAYMYKRCNDQKFKNFCRLMTGGVKVPGIYVYVQPDWTAFADIVFGEKPFETAGTLPGGCCACNSSLIKEGSCVIERSPHVGDEHVEALVVKNKWLNTRNVCFVSYHDFTLWRLGGADCDGDHVYVVQWEPLQSMVQRIHAESGNPLVWWDGLSGEKKVLPDKLIAYNQAMVETLRYAHEFNLVGLYAAQNRVFWQQKRGEDDKQYIIAASASYAVDAVKTGAMPGSKEKEQVPLPAYMIYKRKVRVNGKWVVAPHADYWKDKNLSIGNNSMDKLGRIVRDAGMEAEYENLEVKSLEWRWGMLQNRSPRFNVGSIVGYVPPETAGDVLLESSVLPDKKAPKKTLGYLLSLLRDGEKIGLADYFRALTYTQAAKVNETEEEDDGEVDAELKTLTQKDFVERTRVRLIEFCQANGEGKIDGLSDEDCLRFCSNVLLRNQMVRMKNEIKKREETKFDLSVAYDIERSTYLNKDGGYGDFCLQSLFEVFGDLYAEAYLKNEAEGFVPEDRFKWLPLDAEAETVTETSSVSVNIPTGVKGKIAQPSEALPEPEWVSDFDDFDDGVVNIPDDI